MDTQATATIKCQNCGAVIAAGSKFCGVCGTPLPITAPLAAPKGVVDSRRLVTVLFADIAGFTRMAERLDPEEVKHISDECLTRLAAVVKQFDGMVDKFMGDNIMVLFGAPLAHEDDAERAILCALLMHAQLTDLSEALTKQRGFSLDLHIGINTGEVLAGEMGSGLVMSGEYTVMGDAVNVAARLQDKAAAGETVVGPSTYALTNHAFDFVDLGAIEVRGKREAVPVYRVLGRKAARGSGRGLAVVGLDTPFVGRVAELGELRDLLTKAAAGQAVVVRLSGEAGAGKSRLVRELREGSPGLRAYTGHCLAYTERTPYWLLSDIVREVCGFGPTMSGELGATAVRVMCANLGLDTAQPPGSAIFCRLLDFPYDDAMVRGLGKADFEQLLSVAVVEMLNALVKAGTGPLLLVLEDVHWADRNSLALLARLPLIPRLMLLFTYRLGYSLVLLPAGGIEATMALPALTDTESAQLVGAALAIEALPNEVAEQLKERGGGNPFFIEELLKLMLQSGAIAQQEGKWRFTTDPKAFRVPLSVHELIQGRLDRLRPAQRTMLQYAAAVGRTFDLPLLQRLLPDDADLDYNLDALIEQYMVVPIGGRMGEYAFRHALIQEVGYQSVVQAERRRLHEQIGDALVALYPDEAEQGGVVELIARQYEQSSNEEQAAIYLMRAGQRAQQLYALDEADEYYRKALVRQKALAASHPEQRLRWGMAQLEAYTALVDITTLVGKLDEAEVDGAAGAELATFLLPLAHAAEFYMQASRQIAELCVRLVQLYSGRRGRADKALEYVVIGERALGDDRSVSWARLQVAAAQAYFHRMDGVEMARRIELALPILEQANDLTWQAYAYYALGTAATLRGSMEQVYQMRQRSLELFAQVGDLRGMLTGYLSNGLVLGEMLRLDAALAALDKAEELAGRLKSRDSLAKAQVWRALVHMARGELDAAAACTGQAVTMAEENGYQSVYLDGLTYGGEVEYMRGNFGEALKLWQRGLAESGGRSLWVTDYQLRIARALVRSGYPDEARTRMTLATAGEMQASTALQAAMMVAETEMWLGNPQRAIDLIEQALASGMVSPRSDIMYRVLRAAALFMVGRVADAETEAEGVREQAARVGLPIEQSLAERAIAQVLLARGERAAAQSLLQAAAARFAVHGMRDEVRITKAMMNDEGLIVNGGCSRRMRNTNVPVGYWTATST